MHGGCCLRCFKQDKQLEMLKKDISGFEAWLPQGQEAQQSQIHSPWIPGLLPPNNTSVLQWHRGISFQTHLRSLSSCHLSGLWIHSPHVPVGQEGSHPFQRKEFENFGNHSEASLCRTAAELQPTGPEVSSALPLSQGSGVFCCLGLQRSPTLDPCPWSVELCSWCSPSHREKEGMESLIPWSIKVGKDAQGHQVQVLPELYHVL